MVLVEHKEYVQDVLSSATIAAFSLQSFPVNPGQVATFPWLSTIAGNFIQYVFESLEFSFESTSATALNSTNTQLGIVGGRLQYDPTLAADTSLIQVQNSYDCHKANPSHSWTYEVNLSSMPVGHLAVRTGVQPSNTDLRMYDYGFFELFTQAMQAASTNVGQLWVKYKVHLMKPAYLQGELGYTLRTAHYKLAGQTQANPLLGAVAVSSNQFVLSTTAAGVITFPNYISQGLYLVVWKSRCVATTTFVAGTATVGNATLLTCWDGTSAVPVANQRGVPIQAGAATTQVAWMGVVSINAPGNTFASLTIVITTMGTTCDDGDLWVTQINGLISS